MKYILGPSSARLIYCCAQLRRGVASLPKNIALARTIAEAEEGRSSPRCTEHPRSTASLYCHTCSKNICLNCYFSSIGKGDGDKKAEGSHNGHDVKTSDAVLAKEKVRENY